RVPLLGLGHRLLPSDRGHGRWRARRPASRALDAGGDLPACGRAGHPRAGAGGVRGLSAVEEGVDVPVDGDAVQTRRRVLERLSARGACGWVVAPPPGPTPGAPRPSSGAAPRGAGGAPPPSRRSPPPGRSPPPPPPGRGPAATAVRPAVSVAIPSARRSSGVN